MRARYGLSRMGLFDRLLLVIAALWLMSTGTAAQDYSRVLGGAPTQEATDADSDAPAAGEAAAEAEGEAEGDPAAGPEGEDEEGEGPDLAAYGQVAETYTPEASALDMTQQGVNIFQQKARRVFGAAPRYFEDIDAALDAESPTGSSSYFLGVFLFVALLLAIGRAAAMVYALYVALPLMLRIQRPNPEGIVDKLPVLAARVGIQLGGVTLSLLVAAAVGAGFFQEHEATLKTVIAIASAYVLIQMIDVLWRMIVSPFLPDYRIPAFDDRDARRLYRWLAFGAAFGVATNFASVWLRDLNAPEEPVALTIIVSSLISVIVVLLMVRSCGRSISRAIVGGDDRAESTWLSSVASVVWRPVVFIYMVGAWLEMSYRLIMGLPLGVPLLAGAFGVLLVGIVVYAVTVYVIARVFRRARAMRAANRAAAMAEQAEGEAVDKAAIRDALTEVEADGDDEGGAGPIGMGEAPPMRREGMTTFEDLAQRVASLFALGAGVYALIRVWAGPEVFAEGAMMDVIQDLIDVSFLGYIAYHGARIWMDQKIEQEGGGQEAIGEPGDEGGGAAAASRLATILPLFRSFVLLVIAISALFLVLLELGVNVAPLFAGAGVVGLAIGFGAQSLVRDILSGIFFLSDDAFRKGEYIDIGDVKGTVEKISLRSFQLRHHLGALNTIPFGEIKFLTNYSRDWVMMKLPLRLTYDTDVDKVRKVIKKLGQQLLEHPTEGHKFVQPLKSQGVYMMEDSAMIFRVKFMTRPGDQWTTRKLVYMEIRNLFEKEGIKFAHKEVTVRIPDLEDAAREGQITADEQKAIGAAARRAVEEEGALQPAGGDTR